MYARHTSCDHAAKHHLHALLLSNCFFADPAIHHGSRQESAPVQASIESVHAAVGWKFEGSLVEGKTKPCGEWDTGEMWECPFFVELPSSAGFVPHTSELLNMLLLKQRFYEGEWEPKFVLDMQ